MKIELASDRAPLLVVALLSVILGRSLPVIASTFRSAPGIDDFLDRAGGGGTYFDPEGRIGSTDSNTVSAEDKAAAERAIRNWDLFAESDRETLAIAIARLSTSLSRRGSWAMPNLAIDDGILDVSIALEILYRLDSSEITHKLSTRAGWYVGSSEDQRLRIRKCISDFYGLRSGIIHGRRRRKKDQERASQDRKRALQVKTYDIAKATVLEHLKRGHMPALVHGSRALGEPRSTSWPSWRQQVHDLDMKSSVHPKYKTQYHVGNGPAYERALVQRGDITVWVAPDAIATWEAVGVGKRGGPRQYSDLAIETALTLRLIFHLPLRQTEGFLTSIFGMLGLDLSAPDHTTLSRRGQHLDLPLRRAPAGAGLHLMVDSTGLSIVGEGEWAAAKHGGRGRRGWKKRHLGVDRSGVIVARALTEASVDDATTGITLIEAIDGALGRVTADAASETIGFYEAAGARGATVVVPPTSTANVSRYGPRSSARDRTILAVKERTTSVPRPAGLHARRLSPMRGRRRWKKTSGYHGQARVENAFFRYKSILACNILNQMTGLGRPMSYRIGR